jgi:hypothetical protein
MKFLNSRDSTRIARTVVGSVVMLCVLALSAHAEGKEQFQKYFSDAASKVKSTNSPVEKRAILNESFRTMSKALNMVQQSSSLTKEDLAGVIRVQATLQAKQDELQGTNGYVRVPDEKLNSFSDYVVQDMEQADVVVTISLVTLILLAILLVLIIR